MDSSYLGLFLSAFTSATILPGTSEGVLLFMIAGGKSITSCVWVASLGNVLGSFLNYAIGYSGNKWLQQKVLRISDKSLARAERFYHKYGVYSLLLSWLPVIGDPLTLFAGFFGVSPVMFFILVSVSKFARFAILGWGWAVLF